MTTTQLAETEAEKETRLLQRLSDILKETQSILPSHHHRVQLVKSIAGCDPLEAINKCVDVNCRKKYAEVSKKQALVRDNHRSRSIWRRTKEKKLCVDVPVLHLIEYRLVTEGRDTIYTYWLLLTRSEKHTLAELIVIGNFLCQHLQSEHNPLVLAMMALNSAVPFIPQRKHVAPRR